MPYIKLEDRDKIELVANLTEYLTSKFAAKNAGELNYTLTMIIKKYFNDNGSNYQAINDIIGALESAKLEFYRRPVAIYEDKKIIENGDI